MALRQATKKVETPFFLWKLPPLHCWYLPRPLYPKILLRWLYNYISTLDY